MSSAREEDWTASLGECDPDDRGSIEIWHVTFPDNHAVYLYDDEARAKLIAAAPDLARALREVEWVSLGLVRKQCVVCRGYEPDDYYPRGSGGHEETCPVLAALAKAGAYDDD